jgi:hypothetical protein
MYYIAKLGDYFAVCLGNVVLALFKDYENALQELENLREV